MLKCSGSLKRSQPGVVHQTCLDLLFLIILSTSFVKSQEPGLNFKSWMTMCVPRELLLWSLAEGRIRFWSLQDEIHAHKLAHLNLFHAVGYVALSYLPTYLSVQCCAGQLQDRDIICDRSKLSGKNVESHRECGRCRPVSFPPTVSLATFEFLHFHQSKPGL